MIWDTTCTTPHKAQHSIVVMQFSDF